MLLNDFDVCIISIYSNSEYMHTQLKLNCIYQMKAEEK